MSSFSGDGVYDHPAPPTVHESAGRSAAAPDGGLFVLVGSRAAGSSETSYRVLKLTADGVPDTSFGGDGLAHVPAGSANPFTAMVADGGGRLYLAGNAFASGMSDGRISRLTAAGEPDTTFGGGTGVISIPVTADSTNVRALDVSSEGQPYLLQQDYPNVAKVARLTDAGALDLAFGGGDGYVEVAPRATSLLVSRVGDTAGAVMVSVQADTGEAVDDRVLRLTPTGALDTSFSGDGSASLPLEACSGTSSLVEDPLGRVLVLRRTCGGGTPIRLSPTGEFDSGFTVTRSVTRLVGTTDPRRTQDVDLLPDGGVLLSGVVQVGNGAFAFRIFKALDDVAAAGSRFTAVPPARVLDTRTGLGRPGAVKVGTTTFDLQVTGVGGVPAEATAVVLNVTAVAPTGGFITVWPAGGAQPLVSNINTTSAVNIPNLVVAKLGAGGRVSIKNSSGTTHLLADVAGYYSTNAGQGFTPVAPVRLLDTRSSKPVGAGQTRSVTVVGVLPGGLTVPTDATAVVVNVTGVSPSTDTFVTAFPKGTTRPTTSNLNLKKSITSPNLVTVKIGAGGISLYNGSGTVHLLVDIAGYYSPGSADTFVALSPFRQLNTSVGTGVTTTSKVVGGGAPVTLDTAVGGVPLGATAVVVNVTAVAPTTSRSFVTVYPAGSTRPGASNLNNTANVTRANLVVVKVGTGPNAGKVNLYLSGGQSHLIADVAGYFVS